MERATVYDQQVHLIPRLINKGDQIPTSVVLQALLNNRQAANPQAINPQVHGVLSQREL